MGSNSRTGILAVALLCSIVACCVLEQATAAAAASPSPHPKHHKHPAKRHPVLAPKPSPKPAHKRPAKKQPPSPAVKAGPKAKAPPKPAPKYKAPVKPSAPKSSNKHSPKSAKKTPPKTPRYTPKTPSRSPKKSPRRSPPKKPATSSPKYSPRSTPRPPQPRGKPTCFPGNYNKCTDPRTANLLKAPSNNAPSNNNPPTLLPNDGSVLTISADQSYYLAGDYTQDFLSVAGVLYCGPPGGPQVDISLTVRALLVSGVFHCGSATTPYTKNVTITLTGAGGVDGSKSIMVSGNISWHGAPRSTWTTITSHVSKGDSSFTTKDPVDWQPGELVMLTSTNYYPGNYSEMYVKSVAPAADGGSIVTTMGKFNFSHWGELQTFTSPSGKSYTLDERAQVGLLDRNIVIQGDPATSDNSQRIGGQLTVSLGGNAWIRNVKFYLMGEQGRLGAYPVHWHMLGNREGNYITGSVVYRSWNRCVTIHATDNVLVERNICFFHIGHGFFMEDGCETGNKFRYNLGAVTRRPPNQAAGTVDTDTTHPSTFWITNPFNHYIGNVAAGSAMAGFWMVSPNKPINKCLQSDMKPDLSPDSMSLGVIRDNIAHSNTVGLGIDQGVCGGDRAPICGGAYKPPTAAAAPDSIVNHTNFKNSHPLRTVWITVDNRIDFKDCKFSGGGGTLFSGKQVLTNCLFVGESPNNASDSIRSLPGKISWGFGLYDGPAGLVDTYFTNFFNLPGPEPGTSACLAPVGSAFKHWPMFLRNVEFADHIPLPTRLYMQRGNYSSGEFTAQGIIDDGSLTGLGPQLIVPAVNDDPANIPAGGLCTKEFNTGAGCVLNTTWSVYFCPPTQKMGSIRLRHDYPLNQGPRIIDITRSDGQALTTDTNGGVRLWNQFNVVIGQDFSYSVSYARFPNSILYFTDIPQNFRVSLYNVDVGDSIPLSITGLPTSPEWSWRVYDCTRKAFSVPPTTGDSVSFTLTGANNNQGGVYPNLKGAEHNVWVCPVDCRPC